MKECHPQSVWPKAKPRPKRRDPAKPRPPHLRYARQGNGQADLIARGRPN